MNVVESNVPIIKNRVGHSKVNGRKVILTNLLFLWGRRKICMENQFGALQFLLLHQSGGVPKDHFASRLTRRRENRQLIMQKEKKISENSVKLCCNTCMLPLHTFICTSQQIYEVKHIINNANYGLNPRLYSCVFGSSMQGMMTLPLTFTNSVKINVIRARPVISVCNETPTFI